MKLSVLPATVTAFTPTQGQHKTQAATQHYTHKGRSAKLAAPAGQINLAGAGTQTILRPGPIPLIFVDQLLWTGSSSYGLLLHCALAQVPSLPAGGDNCPTVKFLDHIPSLLIMIRAPQSAAMDRGVGE